MGASQFDRERAVVYESDNDDVYLAAKLATRAKEDISLSSRVEISISCIDLAKRGVYTCKVYQKEGEEWKLLGSTETVSESTTPNFIKAVFIDYFFEKQQLLKFELLNPSNCVGLMECTLAQIVTSRRNQLTKNIDMHGKTFGTMIVTAEEVKSLKTFISFKLTASSLPRKLFRQVCTFAVISRTSDSSNKPIHQTEVVKASNGAVSWEAVCFPSYSLCRGDPERRVLVDVYNFQVNGNHSKLATASFTLSQLTERTFLPLNSNISLTEIKVEHRPSFLDYIDQGLQVSLIIGIDFTKSNKDPEQANSLHFFDTSNPNDYVMAIRSVGEILEFYDSDKKYPVYGFGAKLPPAHLHCSHAFACDGNFFAPEVKGIDGVVSAYRQSLQSTLLHGPTFFHQIVEIATEWASYTQGTYTILLLLTDGVLNDVKETIDAIVRASLCPLSIIIIGVGGEDFSLMKSLDADNEPLFSTTDQKYMVRDIVQFVPFNDFKSKSYQELAAATLDEVPREVVNYFKMKGIRPEDFKAHVKERTTDLPQFIQDAMKTAIGDCEGSDMELMAQVIAEGLPCPDPHYAVEVLKKSTRCKGGPFPAYLNRIAAQGHRSASSVASLTSKHIDGSASVKDGASGAWGLPEVDPPRKKEVIKPQKVIRKPDDSDAGICKVCFDRRIDVVLLPCGHLVVCMTCSATVGSTCPMCRQRITSVVKTYGN